MILKVTSFAMLYGIAAGIFVLLFMKKKLANIVILYNMLVLQVIQVLTALTAALAYAYGQEPLFSTMWGIITCMNVRSFLMHLKLVRDYKRMMVELKKLTALKRVYMILNKRKP